MKRLTDQLADQDDRPDITPLIDVVFMLLLFFIITTTFAVETFFPIRLPKAEHGEPPALHDLGSVIQVEVSQAGEFALNMEYVASQTRLHEELGALLRETGRKPVIVKAHEEAPAKYLAQTLDVLRALELDEFSVYTRKD